MQSIKNMVARDAFLDVHAGGHSLSYWASTPN